MALREVHNEAAHRRQRHQGAGTSMPQLRVDGFLIPCFANRHRAANYYTYCIPNRVRKIHEINLVAISRRQRLGPTEIARHLNGELVMAHES